MRKEKIICMLALAATFLFAGCSGSVEINIRLSSDDNYGEVVFSNDGEPIPDAWKENIVDVDNHEHPTKTDFERIYNVGENYSQNMLINKIKDTLDYFIDIKSEETLTSDLQDILDKNLPRFQAMKEITEDDFTYNKTDIVVDSNISYADGKYTAEGTITLPADKITHTNPLIQVINSFEVEFKIDYTSDMVVYSYSKFIYRMDTTPGTTDALTEFYIVNEDTITKTIDNAHFTKIKTIIDESDVSAATEDRTETVTIIVNGKSVSFPSIKFGTNINGAVKDWVDEYLVEDGDYTYKLYLDEACTIEYKQDVNVKVADYDGTKVYVEITNICNMNCSFCPKTKRARTFMSPESFRVAAEKLRSINRELLDTNSSIN